MIRGIGCDLCAISRMDEQMKKPSFLPRWFSGEEQRHIAARVRQGETAAGIFAAKEALVKALGTGFRGLSPHDVHVIYDAQGAPSYEMNDKVRAALTARGAQSAYLSVSHDGDYAMAVAVLEGE